MKKGFQLCTVNANKKVENNLTAFSLSDIRMVANKTVTIFVSFYTYIYYQIKEAFFFFYYYCPDKFLTISVD